MTNEFIELRTKENTKVCFRKDQIMAVEEIPATSRSEAYVKVYLGGYHFHIEITLAEFFAKIS